MIEIREEESGDRAMVEKLIEKAFFLEEHSCQEHLLVARLRESEAFVPQLSLVAQKDGKIVGYILFTKITIGENQKVSLALAPVAVLPDYQGKGIGGELIKKGHDIALELGFDSVVLLGHDGYYPRFGYQRLSEFGITLPFDAPSECCMALELKKGALSGVNGEVCYAKEFFE